MFEVEASLPVRAPAERVLAEVSTLEGFLRFEEEFVHLARVRRENGWEHAEAVVRSGPSFVQVRVRHRVTRDGDCVIEVRGLPLFALVQDVYRAEETGNGCLLTHRTRLWPHRPWVGRAIHRLLGGHMVRHNRSELEEVRATVESREAVIPLARTATVEPDGDGVVPAEIVRRGPEVLLRCDSPDGDGNEVPVTGDSRTYRRRQGSPAPPDAGHLVHRELPADATDIFLDLTRRCNLRCPACFASSNEGDFPEPTLEEVRRRLSRVATRPLVSIKGGEPTMRDDLPDFVREIRAMGFPLKINTNGLRFTDAAYARTIREAGCDTICIQWDGLDDEVIRSLRGRPLADQKRRAMENLFATGFNVILAVMIVEGQTAERIREILLYALDHPQISLIGFLPVSNIGRNVMEGRDATLSMDGFFGHLERQLGPDLLREDFDLVKTAADRAADLVGGAKFRALSCSYGLFLLHRGRDFVPASRLLSPSAWAGRPWLAPAAAALSRKIAGGRLLASHPRILGVVVEKFRDRECFDLAEAARCRKFYLVPDGFVQPCVHNTLLSGGC